MKYLTINVVPGKQFNADELWTYQAFNLGFNPTVQASASLSDLNDVDESVTPSGGQTLVWDSTASKWKPGEWTVANTPGDIYLKTKYI